MHAPSSQPSTVVGGGVIQVVHQAWTALLPMCPTSSWHNALPLVPSTEARLGCAPLSSSIARPTFLMHGLSSLKGPAHRLDQHADTALVGSGTTSDVAGGAGCVEQTLATNELLLNHHASCKCKAEKRPVANFRPWSRWWSCPCHQQGSRRPGIRNTPLESS